MTPSRRELLGVGGLVGDNARQVGLEHGGDVRGGALAAHHVLGDELAHAGHGHAWCRRLAVRAVAARRGVPALAGGGSRCGRAASCRIAARWAGRGRLRRGAPRAAGRPRRCGAAGSRRGLLLLKIGQHVLLGDAPAAARAGDLLQVELVLAGQLGHHRRDKAQVALRGGRAPEPWRRGRAFCRAVPAGSRGGAAGRRGVAVAVAVAASGGQRLTGLADDGQQRAGLDGGALGHVDLQQGAAGRRGDFGVHLVGVHFHDRVVLLHGVALVLEPLADGAFDDRFAELGHDYVSGHACLQE